MNKDLTYPNFEWTPLETNEDAVTSFLIVDGERDPDYSVQRMHYDDRWRVWVVNQDTKGLLYGSARKSQVAAYTRLDAAKERLEQEWIERHPQEPEPVIRWGWVSDSVRVIAKLYVNERLTDYNVVRFHADKHWTARNDLEHIGNNADIKKCLDVAEEAWKEIES